MAKRNKVRVKIESPNLQIDCVMPEGKALSYIKRVKAHIKEDIKASFEVVEGPNTPEKK